MAEIGSSFFEGLNDYRQRVLKSVTGLKRSQRRGFLRRLAICLAAAGLVAGGAGGVAAQADCLACHADKDVKDPAGHSPAVDGNKFGASVHGGLNCNDCPVDIKTYPHPDKVARVQSVTYHTSEQGDLKGSVHGNDQDIRSTSCQGDAHSISRVWSGANGSPDGGRRANLTQPSSQHPWAPS